MKVKKSPLKILWLVLGILCLGLGTLGVALPILPTVPFYMATVFCFAKSSRRLHQWFLGTSLYKNNLESFVEKESHDREDEMFHHRNRQPSHAHRFSPHEKCTRAGRVILVIVWAAHMYYFFVRVRTLKAEEQ